MIFAAGARSLLALLLRSEPAPSQPFRGNLVTVSANAITELCKLHGSIHRHVWMC